jgi:hypothetical protein
MTLFEKFEFIMWFVIAGVFIAGGWHMTFRTRDWLASKLGRAMFKKGSIDDNASRARLFGIVFFAVSVLLTTGSLFDLGKGTFKWRGKQKTYGFQDLFGRRP